MSSDPKRRARRQHGNFIRCPQAVTDPFFLQAPSYGMVAALCGAMNVRAETRASIR
jgi:hypothetical protein